jgi:hypothetical protein
MFIAAMFHIPYGQYNPDGVKTKPENLLLPIHHGNGRCFIAANMIPKQNHGGNRFGSRTLPMGVVSLFPQSPDARDRRPA